MRSLTDVLNRTSGFLKTARLHIQVDGGSAPKLFPAQAIQAFLADSVTASGRSSAFNFS